MTSELLKDLLFDAISEYRYLALRDLRWNSEGHCFELILEDGSRFYLKLDQK